MARRYRKLVALPAIMLLPAVPVQAAPVPDHGEDPIRTVRLVTGDDVLVVGEGARVSVDTSTSRPGMRFVSREIEGHQHVIPVDALPLVTEGKLDPRLFDVTQLVKDGYDRRADVPLLLTYPPGATVDRRGLAVTAHSPSARAFAVRVERRDAVSAWQSLVTDGGRALRPGVEKIWLDGVTKVALDTSVARIHGPEAWKAGYRGAGTSIGIIDSGVDDTHPDLKGKVVERVDFTPDADDVDHNGHGTHVASIAAGTGAAQGGKYSGVAPDAKLYVAKVCGRSGTCQESAVLRAVDWLAGKGVKIVNLSLGTTDRPGIDPLESAVEAHPDMLFVAATGNEYTLTGSPASAPSALAVGAVDDTDRPAPFSNRGVLPEEVAVKPEIGAPGVRIAAARAANTPGTGDYAEHDGTSMATPHVAGAAALLAQRHPDWTAAQLKQALVNTAGADVRNWFATGAGRVDAERAISQSVSAAPAAISFGIQRFPYDGPSRNVVTYRNDGTSPLNLNLGLTATDEAGTALQQGFLTVDRPSVTVPAGGTAAVTVTVNPSVAAPRDKYLGGVLSATADGVSVRTPMTVYLESEMHTLTIKTIGHDGKPTERAYTYFMSQSDNSGGRPVRHPDGVATLRLPKGRYTFDTLMYDGEWPTGTESMLVAPRIVMDRDQTVVVDARVAKPMSVTAPEPDADQRIGMVVLNYQIHTGQWYVGDILLGTTFAGLRTGQVGPDDPDGMVTGSAVTHFLREDANGSTVNSPYTYNFAWHSPRGKFFNGFAKTFSRKDLAVTEARYAATGPGERARVFGSFKAVWDTKARSLGFQSEMELPFTRTEYALAAGDVEYDKYFTGLTNGMSNGTKGYEPFAKPVPGQTKKETWNLGVLGPAFRADPWPDPSSRTTTGMSRKGNTLDLVPSLATDSGTHTGVGYTPAATVKLTRDGVLVKERTRTVALSADVPADNATYQFSVTRDVPEADFVSRSVTARWTFRSAQADGGTERPLPVSAVRFTPRLDLDQRAPAGRPVMVPFTVQHQPGSSAGVTRNFDLQVSVDDGTTWTKPAYVRVGDAGIALIANPAAGGYVSLKASASDAAGNQVEQTILRAYRT